MLLQKKTWLYIKYNEKKIKGRILSVNHIKNMPLAPVEKQFNYPMYESIIPLFSPYKIKNTVILLIHVEKKKRKSSP